MSRRSTRLPGVLAVGYLAFVGLLTLGPTPWRTGPTEPDYDVLSISTWLDRDTWAADITPEFYANILLFVPLGFLLRLAFPGGTWFGAVVMAAAVSFTIEVVQMWTPRVSDPRDIVANTAGALVGALVAAAVARIARVARRSRTRDRMPVR